MIHILKRGLLVSAFLLVFSAALFANGSGEESEVVNVYSHRHYDSDQELFDEFTRQTGIQVNVVLAKSDELIERLRSEGENSPADLLITVDASRLYRAQDLGLLQGVTSPVLEEQVPAHLRETDGNWYGLTKRARVIVYNNQVTEPEISTYEDLADPALGESILIRSSSNIYNISLLSSIIAHQGEEAAAEWAEGVVNNMARAPQGNDRDQMKALVAGEGRYAVVNTYYVGLLLNSSDPAEQEVGEKIGIIFPNQEGRGTHVNISGAGVTRSAPNREHAVKLLEFLTAPQAQSVYANKNYEYPVNPAVEAGETVASWGDFQEDDLELRRIGENNAAALRIFDQVGWQ